MLYHGKFSFSHFYFTKTIGSFLFSTTVNEASKTGNKKKKSKVLNVNKGKFLFWKRCRPFCDMDTNIVMLTERS